MPGTSYTKEFDDITTISNASVLPGVIDQTFNEHPGWKELSKNREESTFTQDRLEIKVRAGRNKTLKYFSSATAEVDLFDTQHMTSGWVSPAILGGVVVYTDIEKEQVGNDTNAIISLQRVKMEALEDSVSEVLGQQLYGDGTAGTTMGLGAWLPVSPGSFTVAALAEASYPMWVPYYEASIGSWATSGYQGSTKDKIIRAVRYVANGTQKINLFLTDDSTWARYHDKNAGKVQFHTKDAYGNVGGYDAQILGIPLIPDKDCDADTLFGINTKFVKLVVSKGMNMRVSPTRYLEKSPLVSYNFWVFRHQLVFTRRNVHFRVDGIAD